MIVSAKFGPRMVHLKFVSADSIRVQFEILRFGLNDPMTDGFSSIQSYFEGLVRKI